MSIIWSTCKLCVLYACVYYVFFFFHFECVYIIIIVYLHKNKCHVYDCWPRIVSVTTMLVWLRLRVCVAGGGGGGGGRPDMILILGVGWRDGGEMGGWVVGVVVMGSWLMGGWGWGGGGGWGWGWGLSAPTSITASGYDINFTKKNLMPITKRYTYSYFNTQ